MTARCVMVLGTTSGAGKSWLTTALCRFYARQGLKVAPFKAQNMSNNARVVASYRQPESASLECDFRNQERPVQRWVECGEIGSAQYFQALAARCVPTVLMNPLLLKPERDTHSQVVLLGQVDAALTQMPWRGRSHHVWPHIAAALDDLRANNDVVVIEGAGSPAEINLSSSDIVNMRVAMHANAQCLLVTDIDQGGAFAHLYGTWALLPEVERLLIKGFVLNKFRGDAALLAPAPQMLQDLTGVPTVATLPMWRQHGLPEEDGVFDDRSTAAGAVSMTIAVVAYPRMSNLDEFQTLKNVPGVKLKWVRSPSELVGLSQSDWVILPGSKNTSGDLGWLRAQGIDQAVSAHAANGGAVLGICGGLQMLGESLVDTFGIDGNAVGLGLLPLVTVFERDKTVRHTSSCFYADMLGSTSCNKYVAGKSPWASLAGVSFSGYEIHHGRTEQHMALAGQGAKVSAVLPGDLGWVNAQGNVMGLYLHGMFEDPGVLQALFGAYAPTLDSVFDGLADYIETHFEAGVLSSLIAPAGATSSITPTVPVPPIFPTSSQLPP
jgi:adenosylcobyric acid synthase